MQVIPGTHWLSAVPHERRTRDTEISKDSLPPRLAQAVAIERDPGDVVLFPNLLFYRGQPHHAPIVRWSLDGRSQDTTQPTMRAEDGQGADRRRVGQADVPLGPVAQSHAFGGAGPAAS